MDESTRHKRQMFISSYLLTINVFFKDGPLLVHNLNCVIIIAIMITKLC